MKEASLQLVEEGWPRRQTFDRGNVMTLRLCRRDQAGADRVAIEQHRAGAAIARITANFCPSEAEVFTQHAR